MAKNDQIRQIIADILFMSLEEISPNASQDSVRNWDSLQQLNLVLALEQTFNVRFKPEEFNVMTSVEKIIEQLNLKGA
jgi:acyl carrier protein|tara:strand:+ start:50 stop:283 length:234 start_codon:yes stop_codon:yes gene_type:complete